MKKLPFNGMLRNDMCSFLNCSVRTLRKKVKQGLLRMSKINGQYYYFLTDRDAQAAHAIGAPAPAIDEQSAASATDAFVSAHQPDHLAPTQFPVVHRLHTPTRTGNAQAAPAAQPQVETVPASVHKIALEKLAEMAQTITQLASESAEHRVRAERLHSHVSEYQSAFEDLSADADNQQKIIEQLSEVLDQAAEREQHRQARCANLDNIPRWRWIKRSKLQRNIIADLKPGNK